VTIPGGEEYLCKPERDGRTDGRTVFENSRWWTHCHNLREKKSIELSEIWYGDRFRVR